MNLPSSAAPGAVVIDASIAIAISAKESATEFKANAEIARYSDMNCEFFAPGVFVAETLYVLCGKFQDGTLSHADHAKAIQSLYELMQFVQPPPNGEASLVLRAEAIRGSYTCRRSADGLYIALAEALTVSRPTVLLTLDAELPKQARSNAPAITVQVITP